MRCLLRVVLPALLLVAAMACVGGRAPTPPSSECTGVQCRPPTCCGQAAQDGGCCAGTVRSDAGTCVPPACLSCGELACDVDPASCSGSCRAPACCLATCASQADCCAGTVCSASSSGAKKCFPGACSACTGWKGFCKTAAGCATSCETPPSCGQSCTAASECGGGSLCKDTGSGAKTCVPAAYDATCADCPFGCTFTAQGCTLTCKPNPDAGVDSGIVTEPPAALGSCQACCAACTPDGGLPCCPGNSCVRGESGAYACTPDACLACAYGCTQTCP